MKNIFRRIIKNKKLLVLILVIVVILVIAGLYGTFATSSTVAGSSDTYTINLTGSSNTVSVPANSSKTVIYQLTNTNKGVVKYGVGYSGTNITVKVYSNSQDPETGLFDYGDTKFIKLYITNSGSVSSNATIRSILGYENGGNLIVPSGVTLVTQKYNAKSSAAYIISNKFTKTGTVTSNSIAHDIDTTHSMIKDVDGNIRYYGQNPNNYIDIGDNVLWRIIGVFGNQLKLIRSTYITADNDSGLSWDTSANTSTNNGYGINEWSQADLMKLLNPEYDSNQDLNSSGTTITVNNSLWYNSQSGTCYNGYGNATTSCNFANSGLSDSVKDKIAEVTWNTGGWNSNSVYPNLIYEKERGTTVISNPSDRITRTTSWTGKIGLAYPSDYGYATDLQECNQNLSNYSNAGTNNKYPCRGNNWMWYAITGATTATSTSGAKNAWLLTPNSSFAYLTWYVSATGYVSDDNSVYYARAVSPVLYLKSDVIFKENHEGTQSDPYKAYAQPQPAATVIKNLYSKTGTVTENPNSTTDSLTLDVDTNHQLIKDKAGNIRYYGTGITNTGGTYKEPNNYIDIGDRDSSNNPILWRIIGVFNGKLKLIRSTYITANNNTGLSWDTSATEADSGWGINQWGESGTYEGSDLMRLLNPKSDGTNYSGYNGSLYWKSESGTCYTGQTNATTSCNFTSTGLSTSVKDKIEDVTWNLGGWSTSTVYPNILYDAERGTTVVVPGITCSGVNCNDTITRTTTWIGKIGLAYPSDYGYATDLNICNENVNNYNSAGTNNKYPCRGNNWLWYAMTGATSATSSGAKTAWLMTPTTSYAVTAWYASYSGHLSSGGTYYAEAISPVFYLKSDQIIESGSGTSSDPYVLS